MHALIPLFFLVIFLCIFAFVAYACYTIANDVKQTTVKKMQKKNVMVTKDGMKVGVREVKEEEYVGGQQSVFVKAWNLSTWPAYKSRLWNKQEPQPTSSSAVHHRNPFSRHTSHADGKVG